MSETNENPVIRVLPQTRKKLKVLAAQHNQTMLEFIDWLADQQIEREKKGKARTSERDEK